MNAGNMLFNHLSETLSQLEAMKVRLDSGGTANKDIKKSIEENFHRFESKLKETIRETIKDQSGKEPQTRGEKTLADIVGDNEKAFVLPMRHAIKQIEEEDKRVNNVIFHGIDLDPTVPHEQQEHKVKVCAEDCIGEILGGSEENSDIFKNFDIEKQATILGKVGKSGRAPPVLVTMKHPKDAALVLKYASRLNKIVGLRRVYVTPDLCKEERDKRRKLKDNLKKKIVEFPDQHWVIRRGAVFSSGKHTPRQILDDDDEEEKELDRSFKHREHLDLMRRMEKVSNELQNKN